MSSNGDRTVISTWSTQLCEGLPFLPAQLLKDPEYWLSGDGTGDLALCSLVLCLPVVSIKVEVASDLDRVTDCINKWGGRREV